MVLTTTGKNAIRDVIDTAKDQGQMGTGTTAELESDTGLETAVAASLANLTSSTADKQLVLSYLLDSTTANGNDMTEFENRVSSGTNLNRVTFAAISKTTNIEISVNTTFFIR